MQYCKPFKTATPESMTQGFSQSHQANDFASYFGDFLVAPFNGKIINIRGVKEVKDLKDDSFLEGGCGIKIQSIEDPTITFSYWHCQEAFPVNVGEIVLQGSPIACEGNTGFVMANGGYVPVDIRLIPPYKGTHTHISMGRTVGDVYTVMDYSKLIDWSVEVKYDAITTLKSLINKIKSFLQ